uniref:DUF38 domain-containing protein n=1 Tax=Panagrolaimus sp. JU765 TaxID=591449 RepID=A0AC34R6M7_9BILA
MYQSCEEACLFENVRVTGLMDDTSVYMYAAIRSGIEAEHDCRYSKLVELSNVIRNNLPKINFLNSDFVLKRRLYEICFPVIRRKLWLSSKKTGNIGKKPTTYLAKLFKLDGFKDEDYEKKILAVDNTVIETKEYASFLDAIPGDVIHLNRHIEFNNIRFDAILSEFEMKDLVLACNQNVHEVHFEHTNIDFSTILKLLPNLREITYYGKLDDGWENELWCRRFILKCVNICPKKITKLKILADLCRNGMKIEIDTEDVEYDKDEFQKYFQTSPASLDAKPLLSIGDKLGYLKDPKTVELNND